MKRGWQALGIAPAREMGLEVAAELGKRETASQKGCRQGPAAMEAAPVRVSVVSTTQDTCAFRVSREAGMRFCLTLGCIEHRAGASTEPPKLQTQHITHGRP